MYVHIIYIHVPVLLLLITSHTYLHSFSSMTLLYLSVPFLQPRCFCIGINHYKHNCVASYCKYQHNYAINKIIEIKQGMYGFTRTSLTCVFYIFVAWYFANAKYRHYL